MMYKRQNNTREPPETLSERLGEGFLLLARHKNAGITGSISSFCNEVSGKKDRRDAARGFSEVPTIKTLDEINRTFNRELAGKSAVGSAEPKPRLSPLRILSDILFYIAIFVILYSVLSIDVNEGAPRSILGYSYFTVMSSSMKDEIPKGSLIVIKYAEPSQLKIGDNITYLRTGGTTVTHKIIDIIERGEEAVRKFQTKGVNNASPDDYLVAESEVLGKVVLAVPKLGALISSVGENIHIILIVFLLCSLLSFLLRGVLGKRGDRHRAT